MPVHLNENLAAVQEPTPGMEWFFDCWFAAASSNKESNQRTMKKVGMLLIAIGILMMAITGFSYVTREKVVDIGELEIKADRDHRIEWPPIAGGVLAVAGVVVLLSGRKNS